MVNQWCPEMCQKTTIFVKNPENGKMEKFPTKKRVFLTKMSILTGSILVIKIMVVFDIKVCWVPHCFAKKPGGPLSACQTPCDTASP